MVPVQFRMKRSARDWWQKRADASGMKLHKLLQQMTENRAEHGAVELPAEDDRKQRLCSHPINRRIGKGCGACGKEKV
jgi:hypothetical protein